MMEFVGSPAPSTIGAVRSATLRRFPFPYRAALAIASDIDDTRTTDEFLEIQRFLNTKRPTSMGVGVGLEIGNSFFFYDQKREFSFFGREERAKAVIIDLIRAGYIDCLHSYGDDADTRSQVLRALDVLDNAGCRVDVWINHNRARSNLSRKFEYLFGPCDGDDPGSAVYHADVTLAFGIRFAWVGATTRVVGQASVRRGASLATVIDPQDPRESALDVLKEIRKRMLGRWRGDARFQLHRHNELMRVLGLGDGQRVYEFMRYCHRPDSASVGATSLGLSYAISPRALNQLTDAEGYSIIYTHLGHNRDCPQPIAPQTQAALRNLERRHRDGAIFVTTTSKLLNYHLAQRCVVWSQREAEGRTHILIDGLNDAVSGSTAPGPQHLQGLTFYVPDSSRADVFVGGRRLNSLQHNPADHTGKESVTIPLTRLSFP